MIVASKTAIPDIPKNLTSLSVKELDTEKLTAEKLLAGFKNDETSKVEYYDVGKHINKDTIHLNPTDRNSVNFITENKTNILNSIALTEDHIADTDLHFDKIDAEDKITKLSVINSISLSKEHIENTDIHLTDNRRAIIDSFVKDANVISTSDFVCAKDFKFETEGGISSTSELDKLVNDVNTSFGQIDRDVSDIKDEMTNLVKVDTFDEEVGKLQGEVADLHKETEAINTEIKDIKTAIGIENSIYYDINYNDIANNFKNGSTIILDCSDNSSANEFNLDTLYNKLNDVVSANDKLAATVTFILINVDYSANESSDNNKIISVTSSTPHMGKLSITYYKADTAAEVTKKCFYVVGEATRSQN